MKKRLKTITWICYLFVLFTSCTKDLELKDLENPEVEIEPLDTQKDIVEFLFLNFENDQLDKDILTTIDQERREIKAFVPYESKVESLVPRITIPQKATVQPGTKELQDFTNPVEYTVTAEDGSQVVYTVIVSAVSFTQREVLEAIYQSNPGNTLGWDLMSEDISTWEGVTVESGNIIELTLPEKQLSVLPPEIGSLSYLSRLDVSKNKIITIPSEIRNLRSNLKFLKLSDNSIRALPESFFELMLLENIQFSNNKFTTIPKNIGTLKNLKLISFSGNELNAFPESVLELTTLSQLFLNSNLITNIPPEISELQNLESIGISSNPLATVPEAVFLLPKLRRLYIRDLGLLEVPEFVSNLSNIEVLDLSRNELTQINTNVTNLTTLTHLYLNGNQLAEVPPQLGSLVNLEILRLTGNPLTTIPKVVCDLIEAGTEIEKDDTAICETI